MAQSADVPLDHSRSCASEICRATMPAQAERCGELHAAPAGADSGSLMTRRRRETDSNPRSPGHRIFNRDRSDAPSSNATVYYYLSVSCQTPSQSIGRVLPRRSLMRLWNTAAGPSAGMTARLRKTPLRLIPVLGAIGRQPLGEQTAQLLLCGGKISGRRDDLVDAHGFDPSQHGEKIDLATLDIVLGELESSFVDQNVRLVSFVCTLEARSKVDGIADYRKRPRVCRADRPDHQIAGGEAHTHTELRQIAAQAKDIR